MSRKLSSDAVWPQFCVKLPVGKEKQKIRAAWAYMLGKVIVQGGPFAGAPKSDHLEKIVDKAMKLFPWGPPKRKMGRRRPLGVTNAEYEAWLREVFGRTVPSPISYSCASYA